MKQTRLLSEISRLSEYLYTLPPWICHNGIGPTTVSNTFDTDRDIGYSEKIWGYLPVHEGYLPVYFKEYCYLPLPL